MKVKRWTSAVLGWAIICKDLQVVGQTDKDCGLVMEQAKTNAETREQWVDHREGMIRGSMGASIMESCRVKELLRRLMASTAHKSGKRNGEMV